MSRCLYCYKEVDNGEDFHTECSHAFFGTEKPPKIEYSLGEMSKLAKQVVERSVSVPGVQPKLSMSVMKNSQKDQRLTVLHYQNADYFQKNLQSFYGNSKDFMTFYSGSP